MVIEVIDEAVVQSLRRKTPSQRLQMSFEMWQFAHARLCHILRQQHPTWTEQELRSERHRRMLGSV
jgi:hypothetical protein